MEFKEILKNYHVPPEIPREEIKYCCEEFKNEDFRRNNNGLFDFYEWDGFCDK